MKEEKVIIYTDGACLGNPGKGGWAAVLQRGDKTKEIYGGYKLTTNNRMELTAAIEALKALKSAKKQTVDIYTDSNLIYKAMQEGWLKSWKKKSWKKSDNSPVLNVDLWQQLDELCSRHNVTFHWVKGHAGNPGNERCDTLSRDAASMKGLPEDKGYTNETVSDSGLFEQQVEPEISIDENEAEELENSAVIEEFHFERINDNIIISVGKGKIELPVNRSAEFIAGLVEKLF